MGKEFLDLTGRRFERLTVEKYIGKNKHGFSLWQCKCDCGKTTRVIGTNLTTGNTKSCGCIAKELAQGGYKERIKNMSGVFFAFLGKFYKVGDKVALKYKENEEIMLHEGTILGISDSALKLSLYSYKYV